MVEPARGLMAQRRPRGSAVWPTANRGAAAIGAPWSVFCADRVCAAAAVPVPVPTRAVHQSDVSTGGAPLPVIPQVERVASAPTRHRSPTQRRAAQPGLAALRTWQPVHAHRRRGLPNDDGELWQQRTWFNPEDASSWDSTEDLGAAANLVRELLLVDESGALWRMRLWLDPAYSGSWVTQESLGAFSPDAASL